MADDDLEKPKIAQMCDSCGRIFFAESSSDIYCKTCDKRGGSDFKKVRAYIQDNPGTDVFTVSRATGISASVIMKYIKGGKIDTR